MTTAVGVAAQEEGVICGAGQRKLMNVQLHNVSAFITRRNRNASNSNLGVLKGKRSHKVPLHTHVGKIPVCKINPFSTGIFLGPLQSGNPGLPKITVQLFGWNFSVEPEVQTAILPNTRVKQQPACVLDNSRVTFPFSTT